MRVKNWETRLAAYLTERGGMAFAYGANDCALFAAGAVEAITGNDPAQAFRGAYKSKTGSLRALRDIGAGTLLETIDGLFEAKPPAFAQRGDLVWNGESVGVCIGAVAAFVGETDGIDGLVLVPRADWVKAWAIG
jgi:hypothetical protein